MVSTYIELEEACEGTKFFNESKYKSAKKIYADCDNGNSWSDASWAVYEYTLTRWTFYDRNSGCSKGESKGPDRLLIMKRRSKSSNNLHVD